MTKLYQSGFYKSSWLKYVKSSLDNLGQSLIFHANNIDKQWFKNMVKGRSRDIYIQEWRAKVSESRTCLNYRLFKQDLDFEKYLTILTPMLRINLSKFRTRNVQNIGSDETCKLCGVFPSDEWHYIFQCCHFVKERKTLLNLNRTPNIFDYSNIMNKEDVVPLAKYVRGIVSRVGLL